MQQITCSNILFASKNYTLISNKLFHIHKTIWWSKFSMKCKVRKNQCLATYLRNFFFFINWMKLDQQKTNQNNELFSSYEWRKRNHISLLSHTLVAFFEIKRQFEMWIGSFLCNSFRMATESVALCIAHFQLASFYMVKTANTTVFFLQIYKSIKKWTTLLQLSQNQMVWKNYGLINQTKTMLSQIHFFSQWIK